MEIYKNIEIIDLGLFLRDYNILVLCDFHIGYEEALNKEGILIPRFQFEDIIKRLDKIFEKVKPDKIIINGDLKHEFGTISRQEWRDTMDLLNYLIERTKEIILIKGNHDSILGPIASKKNLRVLDYFKINDICVLHGEKIIDVDCKILITGHEHPAIGLRDVRVEYYKCFLKGKYKNRVLIVQPSFNLVTEGTDVLKERLLSPYLQQDLSKFNVYIIQDKIYNFGVLKNLM